MTPRTLAGRALLADPTMLTDDGEEAAEEAIAAIEEQAAQQERERIRAAVTAYDYWATRDVNDHMAAPEEMQADILAILEEPSE